MTWNSLCCSKESPVRKCIVMAYLAKKLSFIFEFQLAPFTFNLILGDPFMVSPLLPKVWEEGLFSKEILFIAG